MAVTAGLSLLMLMALRVAAEIRTVYYDSDGGTLTINPNYNETIYNITWNYNGEYLAHFIKESHYHPVEFWGQFKHRGNLNRTTGTLTLFILGKPDAGKFTVEINGKVLPITYNAVGINNLVGYPVEVSVMPKNCSNQTMERCTLGCGERFEGAEPVQYFWKAGKTGEWKMGKKLISVSFTEDTKDLSEYSCKVKNPISEKRSDQEEKLIIEESEKPIDEDIEVDPGEKEIPLQSRSGPDPMPAVLLVAVLAVGAAVVV